MTTKKAKPATPATNAKPSAPKEDRNALNDRARYDYGILNAEDMSTEQVKAEIAAIDKQKSDAVKADAKNV